MARALRDGAPVVALESTIITHGLPRPENLQAAREFERTVAERGAVPATIAVLDGVAHVGLEDDELERLAASDAALKLSARDLPVAMAQGASGGTTVAATALLASRAGIRVFATGGIGGVHRNAATTFDESADLGILGSCPITVVSGGVKSILDIGATLERLETLSVTVLVFGTEPLPGVLAHRQRLHGRLLGHQRRGDRRDHARRRRARPAGRDPGGQPAAGGRAARPRPARPPARRRPRRRRGGVRARQGHHPVPARLHPRAHRPRPASGVNLEIVRGNCRLGADIARAWSARRSRD